MAEALVLQAMTARRRCASAIRVLPGVSGGSERPRAPDTEAAYTPCGRGLLPSSAVSRYTVLTACRFTGGAPGTRLALGPVTSTNPSQNVDHGSGPDPGPEVQWVPVDLNDASFATLSKKPAVPGGKISELPFRLEHWEDFEKLLAALAIDVDGLVEVRRYGTSGQEQDGIESSASPGSGIMPRHTSARTFMSSANRTSPAPSPSSLTGPGRSVRNGSSSLSRRLLTGPS